MILCVRIYGSWLIKEWRAPLHSYSHPSKILHFLYLGKKMSKSLFSFYCSSFSAMVFHFLCNKDKTMESLFLLYFPLKILFDSIFPYSNFNIEYFIDFHCLNISFIYKNLFSHHKWPLDVGTIINPLMFTVII